MTPEDFDLLTKRANQSGMSTSEYARRAISGCVSCRKCDDNAFGILPDRYAPPGAPTIAPPKRN